MKKLRLLLYPFAVVYNIITTIRNYLYDLQLVESTTFSKPILIVGNLSVGGTGKSPQIEYLIRLLKDKYNIAVLSRGYKRKTKGFLLLNENHTAEDVGDEPLQFFKKFKDISVAVDSNRVEGVKKLQKTTNTDVFLLDDAYQHRKIQGSLYVLLTTYNALFSDDFLLPAGNLRESRSGAYRSDIILVTKCPASLSIAEQIEIRKKLEVYNNLIFFTTISYGLTLQGALTVNVDSLKEYEVLLVTGIANPSALLSFLGKKGVHFTHLKYSDHHHFTSKDIAQINSRFKEIKSNKKLILTTEKDFVRLEKKLDNLSFLEIETVFLSNQKTIFDARILQHIKQFY